VVLALCLCRSGGWFAKGTVNDSNIDQTSRERSTFTAFFVPFSLKENL